MTGLSLAQTLDCILQHRWGVSLNPSEDDSIAILLMGDDRLPPGACADAEGELLSALSEGRLAASGIRPRSQEIVEIPASEWLRLAIWPSPDGDAARYGLIHYQDLRMLPADVRRLWPLRPTGQRPVLRVVGGHTDAAQHISANLVTPAPDPVPVEAVGKKPPGRPAKFDWPAFEEEVARIVENEGGPPNPSADWAWSQAEIERRMARWCVKNWKTEPGESTIRQHVSRALECLEGQKGH